MILFLPSAWIAQVAIVLFANEAEVYFDLDDYTTSREMIEQLELLEYRGGNTNTTGLHVWQKRS